jgi:hypothetical protein
LLAYKPDKSNDTSSMTIYTGNSADNKSNNIKQPLNSENLKVLSGDRDNVNYQIKDLTDLSTYRVLNDQEQYKMLCENISDAILNPIYNNYPKSNPTADVLIAHNHPTDAKPSVPDLQLSHYDLSMVLTHNSVYFIDYSAGVKNKANLQQFLNTRDSITGTLFPTCLQPSRMPQDDSEFNNFQEYNQRRKEARKLLSCDLELYQENSIKPEFDDLNNGLEYLKGFSDRQHLLLSAAIDFSENGKKKPMLKQTLQKLSTEPESLNIFLKTLAYYDNKANKNLIAQPDLFIEALTNSLEEVFRARALFYIEQHKCGDNKDQTLKSNIITALPEPSYLAKAIMNNDIDKLLNSTKLNGFDDFGYLLKDEAEYFKLLKAEFGIKVLRLPLEKVLSEDTYHKLLDKKSQFVRSLFLDEKFTKADQARLYWHKSFVAATATEATKSMNHFGDSALNELDFVASQAAKLTNEDVQDLQKNYLSLNSYDKKLYFIKHLLQNEHPLSKELPNIVPQSDLDHFRENLFTLCLKGSARNFLKCFEDKLNFKTKDLEQIRSVYKLQKKYAEQIIDAIGDSFQSQGVQLDQKLYDFFSSTRIPDKYKMQLASKLPMQDRDNEFYSKLFQLSRTTFNNVSYKLMSILSDKQKPFEISVRKNLPVTGNGQVIKSNINLEFDNTTQADFHSEQANKPNQENLNKLSKVIADFKLFITNDIDLNSKTIKELAKITSIYLNTELPPALSLESLNKKMYSEKMIEKLKNIDKSHYTKPEFQEIKNAFLIYLGKQQEEIKQKIVKFTNNRIMLDIFKPDLKKIESGIEFFKGK